jgi:hypothetical protein
MNGENIRRHIAVDRLVAWRNDKKKWGRNIPRLMDLPV